MTQSTRLAARAAVAALLLSATAVATTGVARAQDPMPSMTPAPAGQGVPLATTAWVLKKPYFFFLGKDPVLTFYPDHVTASVGCGTLMGTYTVAVPDRVTIMMDPAQTQPGPKACTSRQKRDGDKYTNMLNRVTNYTFSSNGKNLTLKGEAGNLKLVRSAYTDPNGGMAMPMNAPMPANMQPN